MGWKIGNFDHRRRANLAAESVRRGLPLLSGPLGDVHLTTKALLSAARRVVHIVPIGSTDHEYVDVVGGTAQRNRCGTGYQHSANGRRARAQSQTQPGTGPPDRWRSAHASATEESAAVAGRGVDRRVAISITARVATESAIRPTGVHADGRARTTASPATDRTCVGGPNRGRRSTTAIPSVAPRPAAHEPVTVDLVGTRHDRDGYGAWYGDSEGDRHAR